MHAGRAARYLQLEHFGSSSIQSFRRSFIFKNDVAVRFVSLLRAQKRRSKISRLIELLRATITVYQTMSYWKGQPACLIDACAHTMLPTWFLFFLTFFNARNSGSCSVCSLSPFSPLIRSNHKTNFWKYFFRPIQSNNNKTFAYRARAAIIAKRYLWSRYALKSIGSQMPAWFVELWDPFC